MSRYVIPEPGGYQRDAGAAFGSGTIRPCNHWFVRKEVYGWREVKAVSASAGRTTYSTSVQPFSIEQPGDEVGTVRCIGCGLRREEAR